MKAFQLKNIGNAGIAEIPAPEIQEGQVLLKVRANALCRTDAKMWKMGHRDLILPRVLGHEFCGTLASDEKLYVAWPGNACGKCDFCRKGYENLCDQMEIVGFHKDGGLAEYAAVPEKNLLPVPDNLPDKLACMAEPLACTINALTKANVRKDEKVLIFGAGPVGLMMALAIQVRNAEPTVCEINPSKIQMSRNFQRKTGITVTEKVPQGKWNTVINAAPALETFTDGVKNLISGGSFCIFSGFTKNCPQPSMAKEMVNALNEIHYRQLRISSAYGCTRQQIRLALKILENQADILSLLIEKTITIEEIPQILPKIWAGQALKYIVKPI